MSFGISKNFVLFLNIIETIISSLRNDKGQKLLFLLRKSFGPF